MAATQRFVLVDGSSYLYRAFHVPNLQRLTNSAGEPTGAIYGVLNMVLKLLGDEDPEQVAVVFDASGKNFRHELYADYKANRPPMPDELRSQLEPLLETIEALGLPLLRVPGVEADDVIGTLARQASESGLETLISTGDKDMAQLVDEHTTLVDTMRGSVRDLDAVVAKFGVRPDQIVDYLALIGDSSDNIPGIPGVGPKTAAKWLGLYEDLDGVKAHADEIKGKAGENLRAHLDQLDLSRQLATIDRHVALDEAPSDLTRRPADVERLRELYRRFDFQSHLRQLPAADDAAAAQPEAAARYDTVTTADALDEWIERLAAADEFAFDTETDSLDYMRARVVGVSFAVTPGAAAYVPVGHDYPDAPAQLERDDVLERLRPLLEDPARRKLGHHLKYDAHVLANHGVRLAGIADDTMLESYVLNSTATRHDMDSVALKYLGIETTHYEDVAGKGAKQLTFNEVPLETAAPYAAEDADVTLRLHRTLAPRLADTGRLEEVYREIEIPLVPILGAMEHTGVLIDVELLGAMSREFAGDMQRLESAAHVAAGGPFNLGSPKQLQEILFERLSLPVLRKTPKGQPSTAEDVLQELADGGHELPSLILEYRGLSKLKSTYTDRLPEQVNPDTGRIHTSYHQAVAATGRLSSADPNLQNIPVRTGAGRRIRQAFIPPDGARLLAADYSQIELRIMAHLSGDQSLLSAFRADADIHRATAGEVFGAALDEVTADQRRSAKAINFGLIYGMSAFGLARQLGLERGEAQAYIDRYFERYPGVKDYMDRTREQAREAGYVETVYGRRLYLPEIGSRNPQRRQYAERSAINAPMQGTAADIIKRAMIAVDRWLREADSGARLIMQVHDELVFEVPADDAESLAEALAGEMAAAAELDVPLKVDTGLGDNWDEAH
jgi:DNA polymerase-1